MARKKKLNRSRIAREAEKQLIYWKGKSFNKVDSYLLFQQFGEIIKSQGRKADKWRRADGKPFYTSNAQIQRDLQAAKDRLRSGIITTESSFVSNKDRSFEGQVKAKGMFDLAELFQDSAFNRYKVSVMLPNYKNVRGAKRGLQAIMNFEADIIDEVMAYMPDMGIKVRFEYFPTISTKLRKIMIYLTPISDKTIQQFLKENVTTIRKYKDVIIDISFS